MLASLFLFSFHFICRLPTKTKGTNQARRTKKQIDKKGLGQKKALWLVTSYGQEHHSFSPPLLACVCTLHSMNGGVMGGVIFIVFFAYFSPHKPYTVDCGVNGLVRTHTNIHIHTYTHIPVAFLVPCRTDEIIQPMSICVLQKWQVNKMFDGVRSEGHGTLPQRQSYS